MSVVIVNMLRWPVSYTNAAQGGTVQLGQFSQVTIPNLSPTALAANASATSQTTLTINGILFTLPCVTVPVPGSTCIMEASVAGKWGGGLPQCGAAPAPFLFQVAVTTVAGSAPVITNTITYLGAQLINGTGLYGLVPLTAWPAADPAGPQLATPPGGVVQSAWWACMGMLVPVRSVEPFSNGTAVPTLAVTPALTISPAPVVASGPTYPVSATAPPAGDPCPATTAVPTFVTVRTVVAAPGGLTGAGQLVWTGALQQPGLPPLAPAPAQVPPPVPATTLCPRNTPGPALFVYVASFVPGISTFQVGISPYTFTPAASATASTATFNIASTPDTKPIVSSPLTIAGVTTPPLCTLAPGETLIMVSDGTGVPGGLPVVVSVASFSLPTATVLYVLLRNTAAVLVRYIPDYPTPAMPLQVFAPGGCDTPQPVVPGGTLAVGPTLDLDGILAMQIPTAPNAAAAAGGPSAAQYGADNTNGVPSVTTATGLREWITAPAGSLLPVFSQNVVVCPGAWLAPNAGALAAQQASAGTVAASAPDVVLLVTTPWVCSTIQQYVQDVCSSDGWAPCQSLERLVAATPSSCMGTFAAGPLSGPCTAACSTALSDDNRDLTAAAACNAMIDARCSRPGADDDPACACVRFQTSNVNAAVFGDARTYDGVLQLFTSRFGVADTAALLQASSCWWPACLENSGALRRLPSTACPSDITQCVASITGTITDSTKVAIEVANNCGGGGTTQQATAPLGVAPTLMRASLAPAPAPASSSRTHSNTANHHRTAVIYLGVALGVLVLGIVAIGVVAGVGSSRQRRQQQARMR